MPAMRGPMGGVVQEVFGYMGLGLADLDGFGACRRDSEGWRDDGEVTQKQRQSNPEKWMELRSI